MTKLNQKRSITLPIWAYPIVMGLPLFIGITAWYLIDKNNREKLEQKIELIASQNSGYNYQSTFEENEANKMFAPIPNKLPENRVHYFLRDNSGLVENDTTASAIKHNTYTIESVVSEMSKLNVDVTIHLPRGYYYTYDFKHLESYEKVIIQGSSGFSTSIDIVGGDPKGFFSQLNFSAIKYKRDREIDI